MTNAYPYVFPTMITPYTDDNRIDYEAVEALVEYYAEKKCDGIFALCQSSEIFYLSEDEKREIMKRIMDVNKGRMKIVASSHTACDINTQIKQLGAMADLGADASVIITNRLADPHDSDDVFKRNMEIIMKALPDVKFGLYECPYPYKRIVSAELTRWCADTGRVFFVKDTTCDVKAIKAKIEAAQGTPMSIYNANSATLLESLKVGARGFSGVMANFHADLYVSLINMYKAGDPRAEELQAFLTLSSFIEGHLYPVCAKAYRKMLGMNIGIHSRAYDAANWNPTLDSEIRQLFLLETLVRERLGLKE